MQFLYHPLIWGFLLVLLPLLIHLINMMRHRRVQWAAMDFLLASYRKHRRWVWLKQFLLLLLRMMAIAAAVAMLAHLVFQGAWNNPIGKRKTHHFVLLDDSLSMSDRSGSGTAFDRGRRAISQLASTAATGDQQQLITLIRYSQAARVLAQNEVEGTIADLNAVTIAGPLETLLEQQDKTLEVSQLAVDVQPALSLAERLIRGTKNQSCRLHLVSDFRKADWQEPAEVRETLSRIAKLDTSIDLIRCTEDEANNLAVQALTPEVGTQAAGVPLFMKVVVKNLGNSPAERVRVRTRTVFYPTSPVGSESAPQEAELPDILIDRIEAGATTTRTFQVFFATPGHHVVSVELPADALTADNRRSCVLSLEEGESALIVDGDPEERSAYYLESIFRPGSKAKTGVTPTVQPLTYLRDASPDELSRHRAIYLLDVPPLNERALTNLRTYVERGGGLACFLGPNTNAAFYCDWYEAGLFPLPVGLPQPYVATNDLPTADLQFEDHPVFRALAGQRNPFASAIRIREAVPVQSRWTPPPDSGIQILARLPDGQPLVVERLTGAGRTVAFLTTLAPDWNNWSLEPSFIVVALQLHAYLAQPQRPRADRLVGDALKVQVDSREFQPELTFLTPTNKDGVTREFTKVAESGGRPDSTLLTAELSDVVDGGQYRETDFCGIYDVQRKTLDGQVQHQRFALNVDTRESALASLDAVQIRQALEPLSVMVFQADQRITTANDAGRSSWSEILLALLLLILLLEQWLAYRFSYHPYAVQTPAMQTPGGAA